ncbi:MAG: CDP-diacylglycerol--glycerol-3-phosphate 3-phosphatidyltransferase [Clostridiales bacterium 38_11]|nr:MAG: CDP-diacylglycerol--glycerol-3-phosphate 3-phosphatidyltransferase [Clostridiales bacterium 38_11]HBH13130.1 CDP-diacylglycerol--glycerol-3-phosphate 3-phosphatidyltransferase [Clostridiales bacterium]
MNLPNKLTIIRVLFIPFFMFFLMTESIRYASIMALILYVVASLTDTLDGYIARKYKMITDFGKFIDPLADKLLVTASLICFVELGYINSWIAMVIISRELIITGFRTLAASKGITLAANNWGKLKTIFQMITIMLVLTLNAGLPYDLWILTTVLWAITIILTLLSGTIYLWENKSILK